MSNRMKFVVAALLCAGFYVVVSGGVTVEESHIYYAFAAAILLVFGFVKADAVVNYVGNKFGFKKGDAEEVKPEDPKP